MLTPMLKQLKLDIQTDTDLSVSISAPMLKKVEWFRSFREMYLLFGFWYLESTDMRTADSFGPGGGDYWRNEDSCAHHLCLVIVASVCLFSILPSPQNFYSLMVFIRYMHHILRNSFVLQRRWTWHKRLSLHRRWRSFWLSTSLCWI